LPELNHELLDLCANMQHRLLVVSGEEGTDKLDVVKNWSVIHQGLHLQQNRGIGVPSQYWAVDALLASKSAYFKFAATKLVLLKLAPGKLLLLRLAPLRLASVKLV